MDTTSQELFNLFTYESASTVNNIGERRHKGQQQQDESEQWQCLTVLTLEEEH